MTIRNSSPKRALFAFFSMLFGALMMMTLVVLLNKVLPPKEEKVKKQSRFIEVKKSKKTQTATKPKPKPKPKKTKATPKAPLPSLSSALSGIDMDIPEFAVEDIAGDASSLLGDVGKDLILTESTVDVKPRVVSRAPVTYPRIAMKKNIKGYVIVNLLIDQQGNVEIAQILESSPPVIFDNAALSGVKEWKFAPAKYKGNPVKIWAKQKISFDFN